MTGVVHYWHVLHLILFLFPREVQGQQSSTRAPTSFPTSTQVGKICHLYTISPSSFPQDWCCGTFPPRECQNYIYRNYVCQWTGVSCRTYTGTPDSLKLVSLPPLTLTRILPLIGITLPQVTLLQLSGNVVQGPLPSEISTLRSLFSLSLADNNFNGTLPSEIGYLTGLTALSLSSNRFSKTLPYQMFKLGKLQSLSLDNNDFTGPFPVGLANLPNLREISWYGNSFSGDFPLRLCSMPVFFGVCNCDPGKFANPQTLGCMSCPVGYVSKLGAMSSSDCIYVVSNVVFSLVALSCVMLIGSIYIFRGHYNRIAFIRRERIVLPQLFLLKHLDEAVRNLTDLFVRVKKSDTKSKNSKSDRCTRLFTFYILSLSLIPVIIFLSFMIALSSIMVDVLILFRGLRFKFSYLSFIVKTLKSLGANLALMLYPLQGLLTFINSIKIDLSAIQITCAGATAPVNLLLDYVILGAVVVVVKSDYQVLRSTAFRNVLEKVGAMSLSPEFSRYASTNLGWSDSKTLRFIFYAAISFVLTYAIDYQLILRFCMSLVRFDFWDSLSQATSSGNACNGIAGLEGFDSAMAALAFVCAGFILLPTIYELGKLVVKKLPPSASTHAEESHLIRQMATDIQATAARKRRCGCDQHLFDVVFWIPSFLAPDLWIAWMSSFWIKLLQKVVPRFIKGKRQQSVSLGWKNVNLQLETVNISTEKEHALRFFFCCSSDNIFLSVFAPHVEDANYEFKNGMRATFEGEPSIVELMKQPKSAEDPATLEKLLNKIEYARWMNHCRFHQLPSYCELLFHYERRHSSCLFDYFVFTTMGLFSHFTIETGQVVAEQILANYAVFFTSALGWLNKYTQLYYGIEETVEIMRLELSEENGGSSEKQGAVRRHEQIEIVEHWIQFSSVWAAIIGPRSILFQIIPQLTPLMTFSKIMATSPIWVSDPHIPLPGLFDVNSFFRKARREVYSRADAINADVNAADDQEWVVYLETMYQFGSSSRLAQMSVNVATLVLVFAWAGAGGAGAQNGEFLSFLLATAFAVFGLVGCIRSLKWITLVGRQLQITDEELPFTHNLRSKIDDYCKKYDAAAYAFTHNGGPKSGNGGDDLNQRRQASSHAFEMMERSISSEATEHGKASSAHEPRQEPSLSLHNRDFEAKNPLSLARPSASELSSRPSYEAHEQGERHIHITSRPSEHSPRPSQDELRHDHRPSNEQHRHIQNTEGRDSEQSLRPSFDEPHRPSNELLQRALFQHQHTGTEAQAPLKIRVHRLGDDGHRAHRADPGGPVAPQVHHGPPEDRRDYQPRRHPGPQPHPQPHPYQPQPSPATEKGPGPRRLVLSHQLHGSPTSPPLRNVSPATHPQPRPRPHPHPQQQQQQQQQPHRPPHN